MFFPYDSENKRRDLRWDAPKLEPWPPGSEAEDPDASNDQSAEYGLRIYNDDLPSGMSSAPVDISSPGGTLRMRLLGGFVGVEQDPKTLTLRPALSWCATECVKKARKSGNTGRRQRRKLS